jgi:uncharacterized protein
MDTGNRVDYLKAKIDRSREELKDSRDLFDQGRYRLAVTRAYYGIFHIVSATLAAMGHVRSKHSGIEAAFHQYLIRTGLLGKELGVTYKLARKLREDADYGIDKLITEEMAKDIIEQCQRLEEHVEAYLIESGMMTS